MTNTGLNLPRLSRRGFSGLMLAPVLASAQESSWKIAYRAAREMSIADFAVPDSGSPVAVGVEAGRGKPVALVQTGTEEWTTRTLPERPISLHLSAHWWLAAASGLWRSADLGETWKLAHKALNLLRVYFVTDLHGYALGGEKTILETTDAGQTWAALAAAAEPSTNATYTTYHWVEFVTPKVGIITGASRPPRAGRTGPLPAWRDPQPELRRREWPAASLTLETRDGGVKWKHTSTSLFGRITRVRYARDGKGLALVEFYDAFDYPSEIFSIDLRSGQSDRVFRQKDRAVTDLLLFPGQQAFLAAIEPPADPAASSLGAVHFLTSEDLKEWAEMPVPDGLQAGRLWMGGNPALGLWAATDNGVILKIS